MQWRRPDDDLYYKIKLISGFPHLVNPGLTPLAFPPGSLPDVCSIFCHPWPSLPKLYLVHSAERLTMVVKGQVIIALIMSVSCCVYINIIKGILSFRPLQWDNRLPVITFDLATHISHRWVFFSRYAFYTIYTLGSLPI